MSRMLQQTQALAGIMQAVCQIEDIANRGETDAAATRVSLTAILHQSSADLDAAIGSAAQLRYGLLRMLKLLQGEQQYLPALHYAMAVMQIARNLRRTDKIQQNIAKELHLIKLSSAVPKAGDTGNDAAQPERDHSATLPDRARTTSTQTRLEPELVAQLADIWTTHVRQLEPKVVVHGKPLYLQNEDNIQLIRALLLAALRCSWLWSQLGGRRWHLLLRRRMLLQDTNQLLAESGSS